MPRSTLLVLLVALGLCAPAAAQIGFGAFNERNHPEIDWRVAVTEHFEIMYPAHLAGIEHEAATVAEASFDALTTVLGDSTPVAFPRRIRLYLSDEDEIANGIAYDVGRAGFTTLWVHVNDAAEVWTGDAKWLRKVIAHELAHIVHFRAVQSNLGLLSTFFADPLPSFWTEGLAQYLTERWDAQRGERWLRTAAFEDRLGYADGSSAQNGRLKYAVGNSQVRFLAEQLGDSTIARILAHRTPVLFGLGRVNDFQTSFRAVTRRPFSDFAEQWRKTINVHYNTMAGQMERLDSLGTRPLALPGQVVYDVAFSPDTTQIAAVVLTSLARPVIRLYVRNNPGADSTRRASLRVLAEGAIQAPIAWSPDGARIAYARTRRGAQGALLRDLYVVDVASKRTRRLTTDRRASSPTFAPDGRRLAFVGVRGGTANLFLLDIETGAEAPLTAFSGDVQITSARWSPSGRHIAFAAFDAERRRSLMTVDVETRAVQRLATGDGVEPFLQDDRLPVWNAAGDALAFTSLRDGVPNVFLARVTPEGASPAPPVTLPADLPAAPDSLAAPDALAAPDSTLAQVASVAPAETRATYLFTGATVRDWLPPDSLNPAGRLVLVSSETKRRDRVTVVPADRSLTVPVPDTLFAPPGYDAWTRHRPRVTIPDDLPTDTTLVRGRHAYRSLRNLTHAITLPLPYADPANNDYGVFANSIWLEPLGKHQLFVLGGVSVTRPVSKSFLLLSYTNRQLAPTLTLDLYRFPSPSSFYGNSVLVEDLTGGDVSATLPLDVIDRPFTTVLAGARLRYAYAAPLDVSRFTDLSGAGRPLPLPEAGTRFDVQLGLAYKFQRPYRYNVIAPMDGTGARLRVTSGLPGLSGHGLFARPDLLAYHVARGPAGSRVFLTGRATAQVGDGLPQDYVGLGRFDDVNVQLPFLGAVTLDDAERVRGYRSYAVGTRALFGSAELRLPVLFDLETTLLGLARFGAVSPALFADAGMVWTGADLDAAVRRLGLGVELKNVVSLGGFEILHAVGLAAPAGALDEVWDGSVAWGDLDPYYRIQAALPF
jgi:hypothetical protein